MKSELAIISEKVQTIGHPDLISEIAEYLNDIVDDQFIEENSIEDLLNELSLHLSTVLTQNVDE